MQNLFPNSLNHDFKGLKDAHDLKTGKKSSNQVNQKNQGSDSVPNYRFPEFEDDGEWVLKPFSKFIKLYRGSSPRPIREYLTEQESGVNWIKIGDTSSTTDFLIRSISEKITPKGAEKSRRVKKGELILANSMSYGSTYLLEVEGCIYDGWFVLREYEESFDKQFLLQLLNSEYTQGQYKKYAAGGIVKNISSEIVYSIILPKTSKKEQQKIASCLSAVDELITAQQDKIEQLLQHKKGLMQGLFPESSRRMFPKIGR
jgi:type I restriction enzyme S subunit